MKGRKPTFHIPVGPGWWVDWCNGYLANLARKGRRINTSKAYLFELRAFGRWLDLVHVAEPAQLTGAHVDRFQDWRAGHVTAKTQQVSASAVRGIFRWASVQEPALAPPALWLRVTSPRIGQVIPRPIPRPDLQKLLVALARPTEDLLRLRTRALFHVILSSGARISEALSLEHGQLQSGMATVIQKGGSEKVLMISETADEAVADYLRARVDGCGALFVDHGPGQRWLATVAGVPLQPARLTIKEAQRAWTDLCAELGIQRFTSHQIRHSCATELLRTRQVDSLVIAKHMGHRGLASIQGYAEVDLEERQRMIEILNERLRVTSAVDAVVAG